MRTTPRSGRSSTSTRASITTPAESLSTVGDFCRVHASDGFPLAAWSNPLFSEPARQKRSVSTSKSGLRLLFAHATGFCGAVWRPVREGLGEYSSTIWDFRGHGASRSWRDRRSWWEMAADALSVRDAAVAEASEDTRVVGVGHSMGGASLVMAELLSPGSFDALVLIEPIIFGPPFARDSDHPLVGLALRRRDTFESRDAVLASYASKLPFAAWDRAALEGYVEGGFVEADGVTQLACRPTTEAEVFTAAGAHAAWERLSEVSLPTTILYGATTDTYPSDHAQTLAARFGNATAAAVEDTGHFLPMERPQVVVSAVRQSIAGLS